MDMFEYLDMIHTGIWTFYLFLWALMVASGGASELESRRADDYDQLRQVAFTYREMSRYQECVETAHYHRKLTWRWDVLFYVSAAANIGTGHLLGIFPWQ